MGSSTKRTEQDVGAASAAPASSRARAKRALPIRSSPVTTAPSLRAKLASLETSAKRVAPAPARTKAKTPPFARNPVLQELEPRLLMSADLNPLSGDALLSSPALAGAEFRSITDTGTPAVVTSAAVAPIQRTNELVFVDTATPDYQSLIDSMRESALGQGRNLEFVLIDQERDGIRKITDTLAKKSDLDAIHIISHAQDGAVQLGSSKLDFETLIKRAAAVKKWGEALTENGDILFYGCDLAATEQGKSLLEAMSRLTGADVAASDDLTGAAAQGGDWDLEFRTGAVEAAVAVDAGAQAEWDHTLATYTVNTTADNTTVDAFTTLREAIIAANGTAGVADVITFSVAGTINLTSALPTISDTLNIDGTSAPGYAGTPRIELNGTGAGAGVSGLTITANNSTVQGLAINRFSGNGIVIDGGDNNVISRNYIGTDTTGTIDRGNAQEGIRIDNNAVGNLIGGVGAGNVVAANDWGAIRITGVMGGTPTGNRVEGNWFGTNTAQAATFSGSNGFGLVEMDNGASNNTIGGVNAGQGNVIAYADDDGVLVYSATSQNNAFLGNSIYNNDVEPNGDGNGIDLAAPGDVLANHEVTANDGAGDGDAGPNNLQNFPDITGVTTDGTYVRVAGQLAMAAGSYRVEFFSSPAVGPSGYVEGRTFLGFANITKGAGTTTFDYTFRAAVAAGQFVTATATRSNSSFGQYFETSEFSQNYGTAAASANFRVEGTIFEDVDGDANVVEAGTQRAAGATVHLYTNIFTGPVYLGSAVTDANGRYGFIGLANNTYYTVVDSKTIRPSAGFNAGFNQNDVWAEQTYGVAGAAYFTGTLPLDITDMSLLAAPGALYGGADIPVGPGTTYSDDASTASNIEHATRAVVSGANVANLDSGFSFSAITNNRDGDDDAATNRTVQGSLRQFVQNSNAIAGTQTANFSIGSGAVSIAVGAQLPFLTDTVVIDGTTQEGFVSTPLVELNGSVAEGLYLAAGSGGSTIKGLVMNGFQWAIDVVGSSNNVITGNYLGTNAAGTAADANWVGVWLGTSNNTVGGTSAADRNILSGNSVDGVQISGSTGGSGNVVIGNYIGLDVTGTVDLGNTNQGVAMYNGAQNNTIGGTAPGAGNVISGNNGEGVRVIGAGTTGNVILGNRIGTNAAGTAAIGNNSDGISIQGGANGTTIGGPAGGAGNLISGNLGSGIEITSSDGTIAYGNTIGLNAAGTAALANAQDGVRMTSSSAGWFGGAAAGEGNVISGNTGSGIQLLNNSDNNVIRGNRIGTNAAGTVGFGNTVDGITLSGAGLASASPTTIRIGGILAGEGNTIAFNGRDGVLVGGAATADVSISGNSMYSNGELGIDLVGGIEGVSGWTPNDAVGTWVGSDHDPDAGPNALQNYPNLVSAVWNGATLSVSGTMEGTGGGVQYRIHVYASATPDPTGRGEGERYLGSFDITNITGTVLYNNQVITPLAAVNPGDWITATATPITVIPDRNTSEFSPAVAMTVISAYDGFAYAPGDLHGDNGGSGWSTAWTGNDAPTVDANVLAGSLSDPTGTLVRSGSHIETSNSLVNGVAYRDLGFTLGADGTEAWMSFLIRSDQPIVVGDYGGVVIGGTGPFGVNGLFVGAAPTVHYLDLNGGGGYTPTASSTVVEDTTALLVVRMEFLAGNDRFTLYVNPTPGIVAPDSPAGFQAQKTNLNLGTFSHIGVNFGQSNQYSFDEFRVGLTYQDVTPAAAGRTISGTINEDVNGDSQSGDFTGRDGVTVRLFQDANANNTPDAADTFVTSTTTSGGGNYSFGGLADGTYFVVVDSKTVTPAAGGTAGAYWADQTYGVAGAMNGAASFLGAAGSLYGGRNPNASDSSTDLPASLATSEHVTRVVVAGANQTGVNSAFSFNVVVNVDGDTSDDDGGGTARHSQGTLDQFILNANAVTGANAMRFVPVVATNQVSGGDTWWQIGVTSLMPQITGANTTIDGTAYSSANGVTVLNTNTGLIGAGGTVGTGADGVAGNGDDATLSQVARPELEIRRTAAGALVTGLDVNAANVTIADLAILAFGNGAGINGDIVVRDVAGAVIQGNVIGTGAHDFTDPGAATRGQGFGVWVRDGNGGLVQGNLIGFHNWGGILLEGVGNSVDNWQVLGNEIRANGWGNPVFDGIGVNNVAGTTTIQGNLIAANRSSGIDVSNATGTLTIDGNTITGNAAAAGAEQFGIDVRGGTAATTISHNVITANTGSGVIVAGVGNAQITQNSISVNVGAPGLGIDLVAAAATVGNGVTANDPNDGDGGGNALQNFPVLTGGSYDGTTLSVTGSINSTVNTPFRIEFYASSAADPSGNGEGQRYLGSVNVSTPLALNNVGFTFTQAVTLNAGEVITATATNTATGQTSEFSAALYSVQGTIYEDDEGDGSIAGDLGRNGVTVRAYRDTGTTPNQPDATDLLIATGTTFGGGNYWLFAAAGVNFVTVDSRTVTPGAGYAASGFVATVPGAADDVWADQTYGVAGAMNGAASFAGAAGALYGGRDALASDDATALATSDHVTRVTVAGSVTSIDSAFSFSAITNNRGNNGDDVAGADRSQQGSLRQFILNSNAVAGTQTSNFSIGGGGAQTIAVSGAVLPSILNTVVLDATTQEGFAGTPLVELNGGGAILHGLTLSGVNSSGSTIRGLVIDQFTGIGIRAFSSNNVIAGNFLGTDPTGTITAGRGNQVGVYVQTGGSNTIGGTAIADRNVISGNTVDGIQLDASSNNRVEGNYIGTDVTGMLDRGNTNQGIALFNASASNTIGGTAAGAGNVISGNNGFGIALSSAGSTGNLIQGNIVGLARDGTTLLGNSSSGIEIAAGANGTTVGGAAAGARNAVSGNADGVRIIGATGVVVAGNYIGLDAGGTLDRGNVNDGVYVTSASNTIGGTAAGAGNVISGNNDDGVNLSGAGATGNLVLGNFIGTDWTGTAAIGNTDVGVDIELGAANNTVGGTAAGSRNVISGNVDDGVDIANVTSTGNVVLGNYIGVDVTGAVDLGNGINGVTVDAPSNTIGGSTAAARNVISGNDGSGIHLRVNSGNVVVRGNYIGLDWTGTVDVGNVNDGVLVISASNTIGGAAAGDRNVISGNDGDGIFFNAATAINNIVRGNYIGTDFTGTVDLGNRFDGVDLDNGASNNTIGGTLAGEGNLISGNDSRGVLISDVAGSNNNVVQGNRVGTDVTGTLALGNAVVGVEVWDVSSATIGGTVAGAGNTIAFNNGPGVRIRNGATGILVEGNAIHSNAGLGIDLMGGTENGFAVTANDALDADGGANRLQNYPLLYGANVVGANLTVYGEINSTASRLFRIEFFASPAADASGYGEGARYLGFMNVTTNAAGYFQYSTTLVGAAVAAGEVITATATDTTTNDTSEFSASVVANNRTLSGTVYNDLNGNANVADDGGAVFANATVRLYMDDGDGVMDAGDVSLGATTTNGAGLYSFSNLGNATYWVTVDSKTLAAPAYNGVFTINDVWADQTYGDDSTTGALDLAARYGGRNAAVSDNAAALTTAEHVARVTIAGADATGVDSGFCFCAIVNTRGDTTDDDAANARLQQGSLRQFVLNSNAIAGVQTSNFSIGGGGAQTITLTASLANLTDAAVLNATTQEGFAGSPLIELRGGGVAVNAFNVQTAGSGSTIRGFVISGFTADAIELIGDNNLVAGNWIGTDATGNAAAALRNAEAGVRIRAGADNNTVGGTTAADRNVLSGNGIGGDPSDNGLTLLGGNNTIQGNYIGVGADGTTVIGNTDEGMDVGTGATNNLIGGLVAGAGNIIAGSVGNLGIAVQNTASGTSIVGNTIYGNDGGIRIQNTSTGTTVSRNSIYGNARLGINLAGGVETNDVTANDLGDADTGPNGLQNFPVLASAVTNGATQITIIGSLNSTASRTFRIEFFSNPAADAPSGHGEGQTYLGFVDVTTDGSGNASFNTTLAANVPVGASITATATDLTANETSEFALNIAASAGRSVSGTVYDDRNGDAAVSGAEGVFANATVRLYADDGDGVIDAGDIFLASQATDALGAYAFSGLGNATYWVTVDSKTLTAPAYNGAFTINDVWAEQTYAAAGGANNAAGTTFTGAAGALYGGRAAATTDDASALATAEHVVRAVVAGANVTGIDAGFSFSAVVNTRGDTLDADGGGTARLHQGSLRQFILNSNAIAGVQTSNFSIGGGGAQSIAPTAALATITDAVVLDATTQEGFAGTPLIELRGNLAGAGVNGFLISSAGASTVRGFAIDRFTDRGIRISAGSGHLIAGNLIGTDAADSAGIGNLKGISVNGATSVTIGGAAAADRNVISGNVEEGIVLNNADGSIVRGNRIGTDAAGTAGVGNGWEGIQLSNGASGLIVQDNLISGNGRAGIRADNAGTTGTIIGNTIGLNLAGTVAIANGTGNSEGGIYLTGGAGGFVIGGTTAAERNVISGNTGAGITLNASNGNTISGNYVGTNAAGTAARANSVDGIALFSAAGNTIGGAPGGATNVLSGNGRYGVFLDASSGNFIRGNNIGVNAAGTGGVGNTGSGVVLRNASFSNTIGGVGFGNVIGANQNGISVENAGTTGNVIQSNWIGTDATATLNLGNAEEGVEIYSNASGNTLGGTAAGAGNTIAFNGFGGSNWDGVWIANGSTTNRVLGNSIFGNAGLGIDLIGDGVNPPNGTTNGALANIDMDTVGAMTAALGGTTLTLSGYVGNMPSAPAFAGARVEFFVADNDPTGWGEGRTYLGFLTANANSQFNGTLTVSGVNIGDRITATATDAAGNTSEFSLNVTIVAAGGISGTLYNDVDADGDITEGEGVFAGATANLWLDDGDGVIDAGDTFVTSDVTDGAGLYDFTGIGIGTYYVVVDSKTLSADTNVWADQTYAVANAASGAGFTAVAGALYGGRNATVSDNAAALTSAEHVTKVAFTGAAISGVNSGFSFNAVVNARGDVVDDDAANPRMQQGTLRQFILNANAIAGPNAMRFVPAVATNDTDGLGNNWWQITLTAALPQITGADTTIDGTAYFAVVNGAARDDNAGFLGTGGTVGVSGLALGQVARPELEIVDGAAVAFGLDINGANGVVRDLAVSGFNTADIVVRNVANVTIEGNIIGTSASSFTDPGAAARSADEGIRVVSGDGGTIRGNLIGFHGDEGIQLNSGANNWLVEGNEIRGNGVTNAFGDGINLTTVITGTTVRGNLIAGNAAAGVYVTPTSSSNTVVNNTVTGNGWGGSEQFGIIFQGVGAGNVADRNVVTANTGVGIDIESGGTGAVTVIGNQVTANTAGGVRVAASNGHTIGGTGAGEGNVISGNAGNGISFSGVTSGLVLGNTITGNFDPTPLPVPDTGAGVNIDNSSGVTVGGTAAGARNVISGNQTQGVFIGFNSSNNWVAGNYIGTDATGTVAQANGHSGVLLYWNADNNTIGGTSAAARNLISSNGVGVWIEESSDNNVVSGNYIGVDASGTADLGNANAGVIVNLNSQGNRIGGTTAGERNVIAGNGSTGVLIQNGANGTLVQGNYIGTNAAGSAAIQNDGGGVGINNAANVTIGGAAAGAGNVISGHTTGAGVSLWGGSMGAVIQGNRIGTDAAGTAALGNQNGVSFGGGAWNGTIGGTGAGEGNLIAFNIYNGVEINVGSTGVSVLGNSIHSNGALGINLADAGDPPSGVTANDAGDGDGGANRLQNYPVLTTANVTGPNITVAGTLNSAVGGSFRLEFFASAAADPSGYGEGERYLGALAVTDGGMNDADGIANGTIVFSTTLAPAQAVLGGEMVSATATALATGDTSEFSANHAANTAPVNTVPATATVNEDTAFAFTGANLISVADAQNNLTQVVLTVANGTLSAAGPGTVVGSGTASVTITGTQANINASLATLAYQGMLNYNGADTLTVVSTDAGGMTDSDSVAITVNPMNDAPTASAPASYNATEQTLLNLAGTLSVADVDAGAGLVTVTVSVVSGQINAGAGGTGAIVAGSTTNTVTITGTLAQVANVLAGNAGATIGYFNASDTPPATDTLTLSINDGGNTGAGGAQIASANSTINLAAVNDGPSASAPAAYAATEQVPLSLASASLTVFDVDSLGAVETVTLSVLSGTLNAAAGATGVTIGGDGTNTLTLTGTVAQLNNLLTGGGGSTLTYVINSDTPPATDTLTIAINDGGNTGSGGPLTASANSTINITALNDAPVNAVPVSITVTEDVATALTGISIADVDAGAGNVLVTLSVPSGTLAAITGGGVTVGGSGSGTLTLTGTVTDINTFIAASSVTFTTALNATAAVTLTVTTNDQGNTPAPAQSDVDTVTLNVTAVNDAPAGANATVSTAEDTAYTFAATDFGFSDPNDVPANALLAVRITTVPLVGTLTNNAVVLNAGDFVSAADIALGRLVFTPVANASGAGYASFTFQVRDNGGTAPGVDLDPTPNTITIDVTAVNDAPVNTVPAAQATNEDTALVFSAGTANLVSIADVDAGASLIDVTLTVTNGTLTLAGTAGLAFQAGADGTATMTVRGTVADINTAIDGMTYQPGLNYTGPASLTITTDDRGFTGAGGALNDTDVVNITVNAVNDAPVNTVPVSITVTEDVASALTGISIADVDAGAGNVLVTLSVPSGTLAAITGGGVAVGGSGTGSLTLTGTVGSINAFIAASNVTFTTALNATAAVTLTVTTDDQGNTPAPALNDVDTVTLNVTAVNDAPVNAVPAAQATNEDTALVFSAGTGNLVSIADLDAGASLIDVTLTVTNGTLSLAGTAGLAFQAGADGTATMTVRGTVADINTALDGMTYQPGLNYTGPASLTITTDDRGFTGAGGALTDTDVVNITVNPVNDAPAGANATVSTAEDTAYTFALADFGFSDPSDAPANAFLAVRIASLPLVGALTNNGSALNVGDFVSAADIALGRLVFTPVANASGVGYASFDFQVQDNGGTAPGVDLDPTPNTITIDVTAVNDAPTASAPAAYAATEQVSLNLANTGLVVGDIDAGGAGVTVTLSVLSGTLNAAPGVTGVGIVGSGSATLTLTGTVAQINNLLLGAGGSTLDYVIASDTPPATDTLTLSINDGGNTGAGGALNASANSTINITAVNDAPVNTVPVSITVTEDVASALTGISIADVDALGGNMLVTLSVPSGTLAAITGGGVAVGGSGSGTLTLTGTVGNINAFIAASNVTFTTALNATAAVTLTVTTDDQGNTPAPALNDVDTVTLNVTAINDAPVNTVPAAQATNEDTALVFSAGAGNLVSIADVDAGASLIDVTLTVTNGTLTLAGTAGLAFQAGADGTATMTVRGTIADINTALDGMTYQPALNYTGPASLTITTDDRGFTGAGGALNDTDVVAINVTAANDAPVNTVPAAQATNEDTALVFSAGTANLVSIADLDAGASLIDVTLTVTNGTLTLAGTAGLAFQAGADGTATMTVRGTIVDINTAIDGMSYQPALNYTGPASLTITTDDRGFTGAGGALNDTDVVNITVNAVNDAPVNTVPGPQAVNEDTPLVFSAAGGNAIAVVDVDAVTLRVTLAATNGTLTLASLAGLAFSSGDGTADATMAFTGTAAAINAALNGLSFLGTLNYNGPATVAITTEDLGQTGAGGPLQDADVVNVTVNAVNDAPVIGANGFAVNDGTTVAIGTGNLNATDVDDVATSLVFTVGATNGHFELVSAPGVAITSFTQAQILAGEVRFVHDGSNTAPAITVYVTDGVTNAGPFTMNVAFTASGTTIVPPGTGSGSGGSTPVTEFVQPPASKDQPGGPQDPGTSTFLRSPTSAPDDGGDDAPAPEVGTPVTRLSTGTVLQDKVGVPVMGMPTVRAEGETIDTKPLRSEIEVAPIRAEMQVLPVRQETFDNPDDEERRDIEVILSSVRITGLAFSVGAVWWAARAAGLMASLLASSPAWRHVDPLPVLGRDDEEEEVWDETAEDEDQDRKDDEHRAAWVLEERDASS